MVTLQKSIKIGDHEISASSEPLFLPDIGTFFNQDIKLAYSMVDHLASAGITTIKGEILHNADICLKQSGDEVYWGYKSKQFLHENYRALIERKVISLDIYEKLFKYCHYKGMDVVVSVYDSEGADFALNNGVAAMKIASSNITHQPLIKHVANINLPMIIDTAHSTMEEIARAVNWAHDEGAEGIIIQHSPLAPPHGVVSHNLNFMKTLGNAFGMAYGLSDHHYGEEMLYAASALGASLIEKGIRPDELDDDQDAAHALPISRVADVKKAINNIHYALGNGIRYLPRDREKYRSRMGLVAKQDIQAGENISLDNTRFAFPANGIGVESWKEVEGVLLRRSIKKGEIIRWQDIYDYAS